jgi:hypothetical protein
MNAKSDQKNEMGKKNEWKKIIILLFFNATSIKNNLFQRDDCIFLLLLR